MLEPLEGMDVDAVRGRALVEESREAVVVLDSADRVVVASRRARQTVEGIREGDVLAKIFASHKRRKLEGS